MTDFYQELMVLAAVLLAALREVCSQSRAALINVFVKQFSVARLMWVIISPESLLWRLNKSQRQRKCPVNVQRGAATANAEGFIAVSSTLPSVSVPHSRGLLFKIWDN